MKTNIFKSMEIEFGDSKVTNRVTGCSSLLNNVRMVERKLLL